MGHSVHISSEDARFSRELDARQWQVRHPQVNPLARADDPGRRRWPVWSMWLVGFLLGICCAAFSYAYAADGVDPAQVPRYKSGGIGQADVTLMKRASTRFSTTFTR